MKCKIPVMNKKQRAEFVQSVKEELQVEVDGQLRDREYQAGTRAECMVMVALIQEFGFGKKRLQRLWKAVNDMLADLQDYKNLGVMDEMMMRILGNVGMDVHALFPEYFEAEERLKAIRRKEKEFHEMRGKKK